MKRSLYSSLPDSFTVFKVYTHYTYSTGLFLKLVYMAIQIWLFLFQMRRKHMIQYALHMRYHMLHNYSQRPAGLIKTGPYAASERFIYLARSAKELNEGWKLEQTFLNAELLLLSPRLLRLPPLRMVQEEGLQYQERLVRFKNSMRIYRQRLYLQGSERP